MADDEPHKPTCDGTAHAWEHLPTDPDGTCHAVARCCGARGIMRPYGAWEIIAPVDGGKLDD